MTWGERIFWGGLLLGGGYLLYRALAPRAASTQRERRITAGRERARELQRDPDVQQFTQLPLTEQQALHLKAQAAIDRASGVNGREPAQRFHFGPVL